MKFIHQNILSFKENEEKQAILEFSLIQTKQLELENKHQALEEKKGKIVEELHDPRRKTVFELLELQEWIDYLNQQIQQIEYQIEEVVKELNKKQEVMIEKIQETKIWSQWKERSILALQKEKVRKEQLELDELVTSHYSSHSKQSFM